MALVGGCLSFPCAPSARALEAVMDTLALKTDPAPAEIDDAVNMMVKRQRYIVPYLRAALLHTAIIPSDLIRPRRVLEKIAKPENEMMARLSGEVSLRALEDVSGALTTPDEEDSYWEKAARYQGEISPAADVRARRQALLALLPEKYEPALREVSLLLERPQLWTDEQMAAVDLEGYASMLRDRYMLEKDAKSLSDTEWPFLQRRILERLLAPYLRPILEQPWDQVRYSMPVKKVAVRSLQLINDDDSRAILGSYRPTGTNPPPPEFVGILLKTGGVEAAVQTTRVVLNDNTPGTQDALNYLLAQLASGDGAAATAVQSVLRDTLNDQAAMQQGIAGWAQGLRLAQAVPDAQFIREILAASLNQTAATVIRPAARMVRADVALLADAAVRDAFIAHGAAVLTPQERLGAINDIGTKGVKDAIPVLAFFLNADELDLRNSACDALEKVTDQKFGRNPGAWRDFLNR